MPVPVPAITGFYAGVLGLLGIVLASMVVRNRLRLGVELGDGGHAELQRAVRVFANFTEYVPIVLLLIGFGEMLAAPLWLTHALAASFVVGRVLHAFGLSRSSGRSFGRFFGTLITWMTLLIASLAAIVLAATRA